MWALRDHWFSPLSVDIRYNSGLGLGRLYNSWAPNPSSEASLMPCLPLE
jgi:hypothetical protein